MCVCVCVCVRVCTVGLRGLEKRDAPLEVIGNWFGDE